jgi:hypothetical protein
MTCFPREGAGAPTTSTSKFPIRSAFVPWRTTPGFCPVEKDRSSRNEGNHQCCSEKGEPWMRPP